MRVSQPVCFGNDGGNVIQINSGNFLPPFCQQQEAPFGMQINILLKKDYTISWVTNGEEAVNSFLRERPDLILMDIRMPVMNGIQATEKIRTIDIDLPIVAVTANAFLIEQQQALAAGCNDIIAKPYTYERLKETIIKYI